MFTCYIDCISILFVAKNSITNEKETLGLSMLREDFANCSLGDCIKNQDVWKYLYPNMPKNDAFGKYYTTGNN